MGQQLRTRAKRQRRKAYLKRQKETVNTRASGAAKAPAKKVAASKKAAAPKKAAKKAEAAAE